MNWEPTSELPWLYLTYKFATENVPIQSLRNPQLKSKFMRTNDIPQNNFNVKRIRLLLMKGKNGAKKEI